MKWHALSIRTQLSFLTSGLLLLVMSATLSLSFWLDYKHRQTLALELSNNLHEALSHDMLEALVSQEADLLANLSFRLSNFPSLDRVLLQDTMHQGVYKYKANQKNYQALIEKASATPQFTDDDLYVKRPLEVDQHLFGYVTYIIDMKSLRTQLNEQLTYFLIAFPLIMLFAFWLATRMSRSYSRPFLQLAQAMAESNPTQNRFPKLTTQAQNEIEQLYLGYDKMMTQVAQTTAQMRYQSEHDQLTGLNNRYYFEQHLKRTLKNETHPSNVLIFWDLDQFKFINDTAGTNAGDELLKMLAHSLLDSLPTHACLSRIGGDDFMLLLPNTDEQAGIRLAEQLKQQLNDFRFSWQGNAYSVSASLGLIAFRPNQYAPEEVIQLAENTFYSAKQSGRNQLKVYHPEDGISQSYNQEVVTAGFIKEALSNGPSHFELYAQAIKPLQHISDQLSYEILLRLWDNQGNFIAPDNFLPTAERYQLMAEIDGYVLWHYLEAVTQSPVHIDKLHLAHVNLAGSSLNHPDFQAKVRQAVAHFHFPWHKLELEVTETSAIGNFNQAKPFINWLQNLGIGLALDDFGTGMSSFEYLKSLPFDVVKIDGSFVKDMHNDPTDKAVIRYIQEIASLKGQQTVAEYIESEADVKTLTEIGITYGQGYHLGKPKPLNDWLAND